MHVFSFQHKFLPSAGREDVLQCVILDIVTIQLNILENVIINVKHTNIFVLTKAAVLCAHRTTLQWWWKT